jgi:tRNA:m4X modification enzyme
MDPSHTVYEFALRAHLLICNKKKEQDEIEAKPFFARDINSPSKSDPSASSSAKGPHYCQNPSFKKLTIAEKLESLGIKNLRPLSDRVSSAFYRHYGGLNTTPHTLRPLAMNPTFSAANDRGSGNKVFKHLKQQASIIGHMQRRGLLPKSSMPSPQQQAQDPYIFCEFGAGRGMLAATIGEVSDPTRSQFLMIERSGVRRKGDHLLRSGKTQWCGGCKGHAQTERIRIDIKDLNLEGVGMVKNQPHIIGVGKHLCGVATDLTLRCLANTLPQLSGSETGKHESRRTGFHGVAIATCCHHVCNWDDYICQDFFVSDCGFSGDDFDLIRSLSSWGVCGLGGKKESKDKDDDDDEHTIPFEDLPLDDADKAWELSADERAQLGRQCKRLIDMGRVKFLQSMGLRAEVVHYCETDVSPENALVIAWR